MGKSFILLVFCLFLCINYTNSQTWTKYTTPVCLTFPIASSVAIDAQGNKWFGSYYCVSKFDDTNWTYYDTLNSPYLRGVSDIAIDKLGNIVISAYSGVSEFDGTTWKTYRAERGVCMITSVVIDTLNNRWFGTDGCGLLKFDGTTWTTYTTNKDGLPYDEVGGVAIDLQGNIWITTQYCHSQELPLPNYLSKFDGTTWTHYTSDYLFGRQLFGIAIDNKGNKLIGACGEGVIKFDGTNWTNITTADGLASDCISAPKIDTAGNMWFGTGSGFQKFDGTTWTTYIYPNGWDMRSYDIAFDNQGNIWLGTGGGVVKFCETCTKPDTTTEVTTIENENHLDMYPNPVQNVLYINLPARTGTAEILGMSGECIMQKQIAENENSVDVSCLGSGIYFVKVLYDNHISVRKIVKY